MHWGRGFFLGGWGLLSLALPTRGTTHGRQSGFAGSITDRDHPHFCDRRRYGGPDAVRPEAGYLRRLYRLRSVAFLYREFHPGERSPALRQHPHGNLRHRAPDDAVPRGRTRHYSRFGGWHSGGARGHFRRIRFHRRDRPAHQRARPPSAGRAGRTLWPDRPDPGGSAPRGLRGAVRTSLQRATVAGIDRGRSGDRRGF